MFLALGEMTDRKITQQDLARGLRTDGLGTLIGGVFNTFPYTSFSQNVGLVAVTGIKSRFVCVAGGVILIVLGLLPKMAALVESLPTVVLGGAGLVMFGMDAATGIRILAGVDFKTNRHNAMIVAVSIGIGIRYFRLFGKLSLPTITLLAPVSPIAWLPVAIFLFGIGNGPAIFMVVIALLFHMVLATVNQIDNVNRNLINVARTMGASKRQTYARVIIPAILPQLFVVLRFNLFAAWMVVLVAEATGVGYGLGQVVMLARNTFNPSLVFFTIFLIGVLGFFFDFAMRQVQRKLLYWVPHGAEVLRGL